MVELSNAEEAWIVAENELRATKKELADFKQKVSDVASACAQHFCENSWTVGDRQDHIDMLTQFIIPKPKPDPLVEVIEAWFSDFRQEVSDAASFRAALDALGFEIREKNDG